MCIDTLKAKHVLQSAISVVKETSPMTSQLQVLPVIADLYNINSPKVMNV